MTAIFGVTGAGLAAHKMSKRIEQNLEIFRILPLRDGGLLLGRKKTSNGEDKDEDEEDQGFDTVMNAIVIEWCEIKISNNTLMTT